MKRLNYIVVFFLIVSACIAQKNADYKLIAKKKIKEIKTVNILLKESHELGYGDGFYFNDSVFTTLNYDKKGRLIEHKDSIKRFLKQKFFSTNIFTQQFDSLGDKSFSLYAGNTAEKEDILDTAYIAIARGYLGSVYKYNFSKSRYREFLPFEIEFYAYSKNQKEHIAFPLFYSSKISNFVKGAEYVNYRAKTNYEEEAEILRNDTIYEMQGNYGNSYISTINCIEKTDSGFVSRRFKYTNDSLIYEGTVSYMIKRYPYVTKPYKFIPDEKLSGKKVPRNSNLDLINDKALKGQFKWPTSGSWGLSNRISNYLEDIKYNDNLGKEKVNLPDIEQEPKYTLKYYKDNKYNIQIKYY